MSEFKFACPVCGQHITCDSATSGSQMECPTCYRKLVVPQQPAGSSGKLILTAAEVSSRPVPLPGGPAGTADMAMAAPRKSPVAAIALVLVALAAGASVFVFREKLFPPAPAQNSVSESQAIADAIAETGGVSTSSSLLTPAPVGDDKNWSLDPTDAQIPDTAAAGRVRGFKFDLQRATIKVGTLDLRQGPAWPPDLGLSIALFANRTEDLAGKTVLITPTQAKAPKLTLRWKDNAQKAVTWYARDGYAARIEFGQIANGKLPGKIYVCAPDEQKSYAAGTFDAEIRKPTPPKTNAPMAQPVRR